MMPKFVSRFACLIGIAGAATVVAQNTASAQPLRGGEIRFASVASGEERNSQTDLWVLDVYFKPMRMIPVELTDPKTGRKRLEYVWYIVYRGFNHKLESKGSEIAPVNVLDPPAAPQQFIPEATLVVTDNDRHAIFSDQSSLRPQIANRVGAKPLRGVRGWNLRDSKTENQSDAR